MKRVTGLMIGILAVFPFSCGVAEGRDVAAELAQAVAAHAAPKKSTIGISVRRISDGKEMFNKRGSELLELASNTKILTTSAALWKLGTDYEFCTTIITGGAVENGVLKGDLIIKGGGDPSFDDRLTGDAMYVPRKMAEAVKNCGIREISGDLVMDDRMFDREYRAPGWATDESLWWYEAPVSALAFNDDCVDVKVTGAAQTGAPATISFTPAFPALKITNNCVTGPKKSQDAVTFVRNDDGSITCGGKISAGASREESIAVENPPMFLAAAIRTALEAAGIQVKGSNRIVKDNEQAALGAKEIFAWRTRLDQAVSVANKRSQNFYAEQIFKTLGAAAGGVGSFKSGADAVGDYLQAAHIPASAAFVTDGCGLSSGNRASAQAMTALLEVIYRSKLKEPFFNSLAVNGEKKTTMDKRMTENALRGRIHAKTGTIKSGGISALSGYVESRDGEVYAFAVIANDFKPGQLSMVKAIEDAVCGALVGAPEAETAKKK